MKIGLGLYRHMLTDDNFRFARQIGCTHIVAHLVDYFAGGQLHGTDENTCWGLTQNQGKLWTQQELVDLKRAVNDAGLELEAIENFDPSHWYDVLLDGPNKSQQLEDLKTIIRRMGKAEIPVMGYNFSLAGVWGHVMGPWGRADAQSVGFREPGIDGPVDAPIPNGQVWNMQYEPQAGPGHVPTITHEQLWQRVGDFLEALVPVAEESGVRLAAHPDDPPMRTLRGTPRLVYQTQMYQKLLDLKPSPSNALEFCLGTLAEMTEGDVYQATERYAQQGAIGYVHCRNIRGKVPHYDEVFIDEGDIDMPRVLRILHRHGYDGVITPDHTPSVHCDAPWHAGMAYAVGYLRGVLQMIEVGPGKGDEYERHPLERR